MKKISSKFFFLAIFIAVGIALRLIISATGYTYDMDSYRIVGNIISHGGNVYSETSRYNYGPVWFSIIGIIYWFSHLFAESFLVFRFSISIFLTTVDVCICYFLYKRYSLKISLLFFLCPISIILTGYYSQFDNFAVLIGLMSILFLEKSRRLDTYFWMGVVLLGFSLMTKHIFFAFPFWLFFSQKDYKKKILVVIVPITIFLLSFIPFIHSSFDGIKQNVFLYKSFNNAPLWQALVPDYLKRYLRKEFIFFGSLIMGAVLFRKRKMQEQLLFYTGILVMCSYAIADQYFAIVLPFIAIYFNIFFLTFVIVQTLFFYMILNGGDMFFMGIFFDRGNFSFSLQIVLLLTGFLFVLYRIYFPKFKTSHLILTLSGLVFILYGFLLIPSWREDQKIRPINSAIEHGDYELANDLYHQIEINPPFAGSRFWYKLSTIRYSVEYYRRFHHIQDIYADHPEKLDTKEVKKDLEFIPKNFPQKEKVLEILQYAKNQ